MKKLILIILACFSLTINAQEKHIFNKFSLEVDPAAFIFNGFSFSLKYDTFYIPNTTLIGSVFSSDLPSSLMSNINKENGWNDLKLETSFALFFDYYTSETNRGFHFGPSVFLYNKSVGNENFNRRIEFTTLYPNLRFGYVWYPIEHLNLYLNPWANLGTEINLDNNNQLGEIIYESNKFFYIVALHIGYSFDLSCSQ